MIQKFSLYVMTIVFLVSFFTISAPASASAEAESNVVDWLKEDESGGQKQHEESDEKVELNSTEDKSFAVIIGQLILYTLLILVLIYGLIKFLALRQKNLQPNQAVQLMGGTPLGNNKSLQLVKVGSQVYLIGVGDEVTLIKEFADGDEILGIENNLDKQPALLAGSISSFIKGKMGKGKKTETTQGFEQLFSQSLDKQKAKKDQLQYDLSKEDDKEGRSS